MKKETVKKKRKAYYVGKAMRNGCWILANEFHMNAPSRHAFAKAIHEVGYLSYGYQLVLRMEKAGLCRVEADHPTATPNGDGAVCLSFKGATIAVEEQLRREQTAGK